MPLYEHGGDIYRNKDVRIDLSKNINPLGMPENVKTALTADVDSFSNYPDARCERLRERIAEREGVGADDIVCGNGACELIHALCRAVKPGTGRIFPPTFSEYGTAMELTGCGVTAADGYADIMFVCTPNNPTGKLAPLERLKALSRQCGTLIIDECFIDFTEGDSFVKFLTEYRNVAVLKAFTKIYAMAGLRLGYVVSANAELLAAVRRELPCWNVSVPAQLAGVAALENEGWARRSAEFVRRERDFLVSNMRGFAEVCDSDANFIFFRADRALYDHMLAHGILIRRWDETHCRVAVSTRENNEEFIKWLKRL
jgi:threonine-phosphate decarboxylase